MKGVHRLYKAEGLMVGRMKRKRLSRSVPLNAMLVRPNQEWAMDFVSNALATGRALNTFTLIDSYTKESLAIEVNGFPNYVLPSKSGHVSIKRGQRLNDCPSALGTSHVNHADSLAHVVVSEVICRPC
ncbi:MAG: ISAca4, transposase orfB [Bryobacterales bacterium]|nr:ISAca4, transposase orfB [Bryobacterales bacterium]